MQHSFIKTLDTLHTFLNKVNELLENK
ncbi:hypothetical protein MIDIC_510019 [Alphaproteobacteria bacterium]